MITHEQYSRFISIIDRIIKPLIWYSIGMYLLEEYIGSEHSHEGHWSFLWSERLVAGILTLEVTFRAFRWRLDPDRSMGEYFRSPFGIIDLIAILPFWFGFFVPDSWLHLVRTLRILRLLKFFRYSRSLQLVALGFYRAAGQLKSLAFSMFIIGLFSLAAMYEAERTAQPEDFNSLFNSLWFTAVTVTTVGYGDISPVTPLGKVIAMSTFCFGLIIFAGIVGVLGNSFSQVLEEEANPDIDPLEEFIKTHLQHKRTGQIEQEYKGAD